MRLFRWIWAAIRTVSLLIGFTVIGLIVLLLALAPWEDTTTDIADGSILDLSFEGRLGEKAVTGNFVQLARGQGLSVFRLSRIIQAAAKDDRIASIYIDLSAAEVPLAHAEELADALSLYRNSGKPAHAYSSSWDLGRYMLATGFTEIWMPKSGDFGVGGLKMVMPYAAELADDLGIEPQLEKRKEFKSAADFLLARGMTPAQRQANTELLAQLYGEALGRLHTRPALTERSSQTLVSDLDAAFWDAGKAAELGFIDRLGHREELQKDMEGPRIKAVAYLPEAMTQPDEPAAAIAFIAASGGIREGQANRLDGDTITDQDLVRDLLAASKDPDIDAIVLRIDSGGGGYSPSDAILQTIAGIDKPVIASMGPVAASGGYMIAMAADRIVAHGATITGSIGVISGKIVIRDLLEDYGIELDTVEIGRFGGINSPLAEYSIAERTRLIRRVDTIYDEFTSAVATYRDLTPADVEASAQGQVWTGRQALDRGLVDSVGGILHALAEASKALSLETGAPVAVVEYPRLSRSERLSGVIGRSFDRIQTGLDWFGPPESILKRLERRSGIRAEMPFMVIQ